MPNDQRNRKNQPPLGRGQGKKQPRHGEPDKLSKRSEVGQAQRGHPELNLGDNRSEDASAGSSEQPPRPPRKAGR
jgi:hypothetical protein